MKALFRVAVINDEITQDFGRACAIASHDFGMEWIELRGMWNKNVLNLDAKEVAEARRTLEKYKLRVTDIASPLFKVDWPAAPKSKFSPKGSQFGADFTFDQQDEVLARSIELAKAFRTDRVRCFDFWRLDEPAPHRTVLAPKRPRFWAPCNPLISCSTGTREMQRQPGRSPIRTATSFCPRVASATVTAKTR